MSILIVVIILGCLFDFIVRGLIMIEMGFIFILGVWRYKVD